jgi:hypothetical protein
MDPNQALIDAREATKVLFAEPADPDHGYTDKEQDAREDAAWQLREAFDALDGWLCKGGFLPDAWTKGGPRL